MKITWFGGSTFRIYIGGKIVGIDVPQAPTHLSQEELLAGVDHLITLVGGTGALPQFKAETWRQRRPKRPIEMNEGDVEEDQGCTIWGMQKTGLLIETTVERPLAILHQPDDICANMVIPGVIVLHGAPDKIEDAVETVLRSNNPPLIALATGDLSSDQMANLAGIANQTSSQVLEPLLALDV